MASKQIRNGKTASPTGEVGRYNAGKKEKKDGETATKNIHPQPVTVSLVILEQT